MKKLPKILLLLGLVLLSGEEKELHEEPDADPEFYMGFICDLPLEFQKQSTRVVFSGTYYEIEESKEELIPVRMVGEEYYILEIDEIMLVQSEE